MCREIAVITPDNYLLHDLSRDYPWYLPDCTDHDPTVHSLFTVEEMPPVERIDGTVAILSTLSGDIYYHWTIDLLPRIGILERSGIDWDKIDRFVVNSIGKGFQRETLEVLGIPKEKIIESDRHPHLQAKELIVPSFAGHLGSPRAFSLQFLRDKFFRTSRQQYPDKIYVSRAKAKHRQVINDTEVTNLLSRYGFETVFLEELSLREQTALFSQARVIVSAHGAGLTNLVFCTQGATVVEIFSPNYTRTYYLAISNLLGLKHYYLMGENLRCDLIRNLMYKSTLFEDIFVNLDYLETIIKKIQ
jgi:capsular polysaccharide biosynthesis protein